MTITDQQAPHQNASNADTRGQGHPATRWSSVMDSYRERRAIRALHHRVEQELSTYTSPSDIQELDAMLERSSEDADSVYTRMIERVRMRAA